MRLALALCLVASPALADSYVAFQSPSGNIMCGLYLAETSASLRCDLNELTPSYTRQPAECEFDWGFSFAVDDRGQGYLACVSDAVGDPNARVLGYGEMLSLGGITCRSEKTGMTCTNTAGHGFAISKARQKVF